jgi:hypothetical protein
MSEDKNKIPTESKRSTPPPKKKKDAYRVFVLQTEEDVTEAVKTRDSIKKHEKDFNVEIIYEPYGIKGIKGIAAIPALIDFDSEAIVVTDKLLCIGNFAPLFFDKPTLSFTAGMSTNVCLVQPWGADQIPVHYMFSVKYLDGYRTGKMNPMSYIKDNYDFSKMFKYKNPPPAPKVEPPKKVEKKYFQTDAKRSPAVEIPPPTKEPESKVEENKPKKKGWFRK